MREVVKDRGRGHGEELRSEELPWYKWLSIWGPFFNECQLQLIRMRLLELWPSWMS